MSFRYKCYPFKESIVHFTGSKRRFITRYGSLKSPCVSDSGVVMTKSCSTRRLSTQRPKALLKKSVWLKEFFWFFILHLKLFGRYISKNKFPFFLVIVLKSYFISLDRQTRTMRVLLDVMFLLANSTQQKYFPYFLDFFRVVGEGFFIQTIQCSFIHFNCTLSFVVI